MNSIVNITPPPPSKITVILRYFLYPIICISLIVLLCFITLKDRFSLWQFMSYEFPYTFLIGAFFVIPLTFWHGGHRLRSIKFDCKNQTFNIEYLNFFFREKRRLIHWKEFEYWVYHRRAPFLFFRITVIIIRDKVSKKKLIFSSGLGWKSKQLDVVAEKINSYIKKEPKIYL